MVFLINGCPSANDFERKKICISRVRASKKPKTENAAISFFRIYSLHFKTIKLKMFYLDLADAYLSYRFSSFYNQAINSKASKYNRKSQKYSFWYREIYNVILL